MTNSRTTILVSIEVWQHLHNQKQLGESMDRVLRRLLKLPEEQIE